MSKKVEFNAYVHGLSDGNIVISNRLDKLGKKSIPIQLVEFEMYGGSNNTLALIRVPDYIAYGMGFVTPQLTAAPAPQTTRQIARDRSTEQPTREEARQVAAVEQALSELTLEDTHHEEAVAEPSKQEVRNFLSRFQVPMGRVAAETKDL